MLLRFSMLNKEQIVQLCMLMGFRTSSSEYMAVFFLKGTNIWRVSSSMYFPFHQQHKYTLRIFLTYFA
jgi:hypothetical protein